MELLDETGSPMFDPYKVYDDHNSFMSQEINFITKACSLARAEIVPVKKKKAGYGYFYAELEDVLESIIEPLKNHGLFIHHTIISDSVEIHNLITLLSHDSGQWFKSSLKIKGVQSKQLNDMQAFGSAVTYGKRYSVCSMLCIATEDDDGKSANNYKEEENNKKEETPLNKSINTLKSLCLHYDIDFKEFGIKNKLDSKDIKSIDSAIENFFKLMKK